MADLTTSILGAVPVIGGLLGSLFGGHSNNNTQQGNKLNSTAASYATNEINQAQTGFTPALAAYSQASGLAAPQSGMPQPYTGTGGLPGYQTGAQHNGGAPAPATPYDLSPAQQAELNGHLSNISNQHVTDLANFRAEMAKRGITDPRALQAGEEHLSQQYGTMGNQLAAQYGEQARSQRANAALTEAQIYNQEGQAGANTLGGVASQQFQQGNLGQARQNATYGNLLQLGGYALGGGFNRPNYGGTPPITDGSQIVGPLTVGGGGYNGPTLGPDGFDPGGLFGTGLQSPYAQQSVNPAAYGSV